MWMLWLQKGPLSTIPRRPCKRRCYLQQLHGPLPCCFYPRFPELSKERVQKPVQERIWTLMLSTIIIICRGGKINLIYNVHKRDSAHVSCPPQHISEQHSMQPKHATAVQSCVKTIANWLFILKQHWTQHIQQHCLHIMLQQLEAALMIISAASGNFDSSAPGRRFSAVAVKLPKPTPRFLRNILLRP